MKKQGTKTAILEAAITIMGRDGYEGLSASRLAGAAGISKANLFHHFRSMDDVPIAAFELIANQIAIPQTREGGSAADFVAAMGEVAFASLQEHRSFYAAYISFLARAVFDPALKEKVRTSLGEAKAQVELAIAARVEDRAMARNLTTMTLALMDGAMLHVLLLGEENDVRAMWAGYVSLLAKGAAR
ncbi:TetR/AcrR family transcriptional regulator [Pelagibacterium lentulum]|uniref:HTH tetR-type domain-containing protein n=1 Tax=Pelagibacterium lentulum TaxID=2029865 RepID=A0A916RFT0_9HYPH|nr:TetR/AcrR family transcriptional regulator [Pelagibacterium lentulum]GGA54478.1 hypothetical protein GCM10011499_25820 [Pelagibacterium lentulum]